MATEMKVAPLRTFEIPADKVEEFYQRAQAAEGNILEYYHLWVWVASMFPPASDGNFYYNAENIMHPFIAEKDPTPHNPVEEMFRHMGAI